MDSNKLLSYLLWTIEKQDEKNESGRSETRSATWKMMSSEESFIFDVKNFSFLATPAQTPDNPADGECNFLEIYTLMKQEEADHRKRIEAGISIASHERCKSQPPRSNSAAVMFIF